MNNKPTHQLRGPPLILTINGIEARGVPYGPHDATHGVTAGGIYERLAMG